MTQPLDQLLFSRMQVMQAAVEPRRTTSLCLAVGFGSQSDPPGAVGSAHLLEHVLMSQPLAGGSSLSERVEFLGGYANAMTSKECLLFYARVPNEYAEEVAELIPQAVLADGLDQDTFEQERIAVLNELKAADSDPYDAVQDAFLKEIFPSHPLGRPTGGIPSQIKNISRSRIAEVHADLFCSSPLYFSICGGDRKWKILSGLDRAQKVEMSIIAPELSKPLANNSYSNSITWPEGFCWLSVGSLAPCLDDPRRWAYVVLAQLLDGSPTSLAYQRLRRESGIVYSLEAWSRSFGQGGSWRILVGLESRNGPQAMETIVNSLAELAAGEAPQELFESARSRALMRINMKLEDPLDHIIEASLESKAGQREWNPDAVIKALTDVTQKDVSQAASEICGNMAAVVRPVRVA